MGDPIMPHRMVVVNCGNRANRAKVLEAVFSAVLGWGGSSQFSLLSSQFVTGAATKGLFREKA